MRPVLRLLTAIALVAGLTLVGTSRVDAAPILVDALGDSFSVDFSGVSGSGNAYPVSVDSDWLTTAFSATSVTFQVTLENTSDTSPAQLTGFGFNSDPDATSGSSTSSLFPNVFVNDLSSFNFDVCVDNGGDEANSCTSNVGNAAFSLGVGQTETFLLTLNFGSTAGGVTLSGFGARLQGVGPGGGDSAKIFGEPDCTAGCVPDIPPDVPVPEPGTLLLVGTGGALAAIRRRRQ